MHRDGSGDFEKVQVEVIQGHRQPVKSLALGRIEAKKWSVVKQHLGCLHSSFILHFYSDFYWGRRIKKDIWRYFSSFGFPLCVGPGGWIQKVPLAGCKLILYRLHTASFTSAQWGQMMLKRPLRKKIGAKCECVCVCGGSSGTSVTLGESRCSAWLLDRASSQVLHRHNGDYKLLRGREVESSNTPGSSGNGREASMKQDPVII